MRQSRSLTSVGVLKNLLWAIAISATFTACNSEADSDSSKTPAKVVDQKYSDPSNNNNNNSNNNSVTPPSGLTLSIAPNPSTMGQDVMMMATLLEGDEPLTFTFKKDGQSIQSGTETTYSITNVLNSHAGAYSVEVSNSAGSILSANQNLIVNSTNTNTAPSGASLVVAPNPVTVGQAVVMTATATGGTAPFTYKFKKNGSELQSGGSATYTISSSQLADAGQYIVEISNSVGSSTSSSTSLLVNPVVTNPTGEVKLFYDAKAYDPGLSDEDRWVEIDESKLLWLGELRLDQEAPGLRLKISNGKQSAVNLTLSLPDHFELEGQAPNSIAANSSSEIELRSLTNQSGRFSEEVHVSAGSQSFRFDLQSEVLE